MTTTTGLRYEGDWKDGQRTGQGDFTMRDGTRYTGGWLNGKQEGQGTQVFANGSRYEGQWRGGLPNGPGPHPLHNSRYDFNDDILPLGAALHAGLVEQSMPLSVPR
mgnify:CR=1 FL=1